MRIHTTCLTNLLYYILAITLSNKSVVKVPLTSQHLSRVISSDTKPSDDTGDNKSTTSDTATSTTPPIPDVTVKGQC